MKAAGVVVSGHERVGIVTTLSQGVRGGAGTGTRMDLAERFQLHAEGRTGVVRESRQLEDVNEPFEQIEEVR